MRAHNRAHMCIWTDGQRGAGLEVKVYLQVMGLLSIIQQSPRLPAVCHVQLRGNLICRGARAVSAYPPLLFDFQAHWGGGLHCVKCRGELGQISHSWFRLVKETP